MSDTEYLDRHIRIVNGIEPGDYDPNALASQQVRAFMQTVDHHVVLRARAGAGKTSAVIAKARFLVEREKLLRHQFVMLTFNNRNAEELRARGAAALRSLFGASERALPDEIFPARTFHSVSKQIADALGLEYRLLGDENATRAHVRDLASDLVTGPAYQRFLDVYLEQRHADIARKKAGNGFRSYGLQRAEEEAHAWFVENATRVIERLAHGRAMKEGVDPLRDKPGTTELGFTFLNAMAPLPARFRRDLQGQRVDTHATLMNRAIRALQNVDRPIERLTPGLRFIFVDEAQDLSRQYAAMLAVLRRRNPEVRIFAVGDDWQAINGFAGSDIEFFEGFRRYFKPFVEMDLSTNFRSSPEIVAAGNAVMRTRKGQPAVARPGAPAGAIEHTVIEIHPKANDRGRTLYPSEAQSLRHWHDELADRVVERAARFLSGRRGTAFLIGRGNRVFGRSLTMIEHQVRETLARDAEEGAEPVGVEAITAHGSKGAEADHVVVLDAVSTSYPKNHPDNKVFDPIRGGEKARREEERCLFHVACTRARRSLLICRVAYFDTPFGFWHEPPKAPAPKKGQAELFGSQAVTAARTARLRGSQGSQARRRWK